VAYKAEHGDCLVPHGYPEDRSFAEWIHRQRTTYAHHIKEGRTNQVTEERVKKLEEIGFNFVRASPRPLPSRLSVRRESGQRATQSFSNVSHSLSNSFLLLLRLFRWEMAESSRGPLDGALRAAARVPEAARALYGPDAVPGKCQAR
jgi:hypothetical protein